MKDENSAHSYTEGADDVWKDLRDPEVQKRLTKPLKFESPDVPKEKKLKWSHYNSKASELLLDGDEDYKKAAITQMFLELAELRAERDSLSNERNNLKEIIKATELQRNHYKAERERDQNAYTDHVTLLSNVNDNLIVERDKLRFELTTDRTEFNQELERRWPDSRIITANRMKNLCITLSETSAFLSAVHWLKSYLLENKH